METRTTELNDLDQPIEGVEERLKALCLTDNFQIEVIVSQLLYNELSQVEWEALHWKLNLVVKAAKMMAVGMLKGTIKYQKYGMEHSLKEWGNHLVSETADILNYAILNQNAVEQSTEEALARENEELIISNEALKEMYKEQKKRADAFQKDLKLFNQGLSWQNRHPNFRKTWGK